MPENQPHPSQPILDSGTSSDKKASGIGTALKALISEYSTKPRKYGLPSDTNKHADPRLANQADRNDLVEFNPLIESYNSLKAKLKATYDNVQVRISQRQPAITNPNNLPSEILSYIFALADYEPYQYFNDYSAKGWPSDHSPVSAERLTRRSLVRISHVCSWWREVVLGTPSLWNSLFVNTRKKHHKEIMQYWFRLAKDVPVGVTIWHQTISRSFQEYHVAVEVVRSVIVEVKSHIQQIGSLRICCQDWGPDDAFYLEVILRQLQFIKSPNWKSLIIDSMDVQSGIRTSFLPDVSSQCYDNVTELHIRGYLTPAPFVTYIPSHLCTLKLDMPANVSIPHATSHFRPDILILLSGLPQLERLRLQGGDGGPVIRYTSATIQTVQLPRLQKLTIGGCSMASHLTWMNAPNLRTLTLRGEGDPLKGTNETHALIQWDTIQGIVRTFLERSNTAITKYSIKVVSRGFDSAPLLTCLQVMPKLKHLTIVEPHTTCLLENLMDVLELSGPGDLHTPQPTFCPLLENLDWRTMESTKVADDRWQRLSSTRGGLNIRLYVFEDSSQRHARIGYKVIRPGDIESRS